jgi:hypothetical protein
MSTVPSMVWQGGDQGYGGGAQGPQQPGGWYGYPPPGQPGGQPTQPGGYPPPPGGYPGPPGMPPGFPPPPPQRSQAGVIIAIVAVAVVLLGGGVVAAVLLAAHDAHRQAVGPPISAPPSAPLVPGPSAPGSLPTSAPPSAPAKVPGWRAVVAVSHGVTYDVPPTWKVQSPTMIVGFEDAHGRPEVAGSGAADYKQGYCHGHSASWRAETAVAGYATTDLAADAADAARKWGTYAYTPDNGQAPAVSLGAATAVDAGGTPAKEVTATVTVRDHSDACNPPRGVVHAVATTLKNGKVAVLIVVADQGVGDAAADADLQKIATSLRRTP